MSIETQFAVGLIIVLWSFVAYVMVRYPGFRRDFLHYWSSTEIARRLDAWVARLNSNR